MLLRRLLFCVPAGLLFAGCPAKVATVEVAPTTVSFDSETSTKPLTLTLKDKDGNAIDTADKPAAWASKDPAIASVDAAGVVKPVGTGSTTITATVEEASGTAAVDVVLLKRIQLQNPAMVVVVGAPTEALVLNFMNERGEPIVVDPAKSKWLVEWKVADPAVATVSDKGVVTGVAAGSTTLTVAVNELKAEMSLTVNPAPDAVPVDPNAPVVPGTPAAPAVPGAPAPKTP